MNTSRSRLRRAGVAVAAGGIAVIGLATPALAAEFSNGSFEEPRVGPSAVVSFCADGSRSGAAIGPWTVTSGCVDVSDNGALQSFDGLQNVDLSSRPGDPSGAISQTFDTVAGTDYIMTFAYGNNWGCTPDVADAFTVVVDGQESPHTDTVTAPANSSDTPEWRASSYEFTATGTSATVTFSQTNSPADGCGALLDDVQIVVADEVPLVDGRVAAGAAALALGGFGVYLARRRTSSPDAV